MRPADYLPLIQSQGFRTLFACVSGAHLYGFESPDSDVDLRGVFILPLDEVLGLNAPVETVTRSFVHEGTEMDLVAHDILKFCRLLTRKNGYVLEQLYSPLVVAGGADFEELRDIARGCFVKQVFFHYRGFLGTQLKQMAKNEATVKDVLYGYRVALTGIHYLLTGEIQAHLPTLISQYPQNGIIDLIAIKQEGLEKDSIKDDFCEFHIQALQSLEEVLVESYKNSHLPETLSRLDELNAFLIRMRKK